VTHQGRDIWEIVTPRSQLSYSDTYAWLDAARWRGVSDEDFIAMDGDDAARMVAHWETAQQIEAVLSRQRRKR